MINTVLNSITRTLHATFGDSYHYYVEDIEQNLETPCFIIQVLNPMNRSVNKKDYYRTVPCVLHYFSDKPHNMKKDSFVMAERVLESIEYIEIDGQLVRGEDMEYTINDDVLQIFITYSFWTERVEEVMDDTMGVLDIGEPTIERKD